MNLTHKFQNFTQKKLWVTQATLFNTKATIHTKLPHTNTNSNKDLLDFKSHKYVFISHIETDFNTTLVVLRRKMTPNLALFKLRDCRILT